MGGAATPRLVAHELGDGDRALAVLRELGQCFATGSPSRSQPRSAATATHSDERHLVHEKMHASVSGAMATPAFASPPQRSTTRSPRT